MRQMELSEFASEYLLEKKLFIVPTRRIGLLMINNMAKEGRSILNLNPITIRRLSEEICEEYMRENGISPIDEAVGRSIILDCLKTLEEDDGEFFFRKDLIDEKTAEEVYRVIMELKSKAIDKFPKEKDLDKIYDLYSLKLKEFKAMDFCDILEKAMTLDGLDKYKDKLIGVAENIEFHNLEKDFFQALNKNIVRIKMPVDKLMDSPKEYFFKEGTGELGAKKKIHFFKGFGIRNEIKYVVDDVLEKELALDEVVIAYTDKKYVEEIDLEFKSRGLGINLGDGLDILKSTSYRFIRTIFDLPKNYYSISGVKPLFFNGSLDMSHLEEVAGDVSSEGIFEQIRGPIDSYASQAYRKLDLLAEKDSDIKTSLKISWLEDLFEDILGALPKGDADFSLYIGRLINLIKKYVRLPTSYDREARDAIIEKLKTLELIPLRLGQAEYLDIVLSYIEEVAINRTSLSPSKAFACKYTSAGYSGRKHLYLIGLDSDTLASKSVESPILLDRLRRDISLDLSFSKESYKYKKYKIREALTAPFESISVGYSNFDMVNVKAKTPSKIYTELRAEYENISPSIKEEERLMGKDLVSSGTSLETLAQCSRKLYLKTSLGLEEKDEMDLDLDRWLNPLQRGSLIHDILNIFFDLETAKRTDEKLLEIIQERSDLVKEEIPPILEEVYRREMEDIDSFTRAIVQRQRASGLEVLINELGFGIGKTNRIFGPLQAEDITIGDKALNIRGAIDRIDIDREGKTLKIIDYKTGSLKNFARRLRKSRGGAKNRVHDYSEGQKLQFFIYFRVLENIIARDEDFKDYKIDSFSYEFEEDSIDIDFPRDFVQEIESRIRELLNIDIFENDREIVYEEDDPMTCRYCEFKNICKVDGQKDYRGDGDF